MATMRITVKVHPRARQERRVWDGSQLELWIRQPPVDGAANAAVIDYVARWLTVPRGSVRIASGFSARIKLVDVDGVAALPSTETLL
jgi:hypothetical protein